MIAVISLSFTNAYLTFRGKWCNRVTSQIPQCTCSISHNVLFRTEMCTFLFWCALWDIYVYSGISVLNGALWDMEQVHCGICELGRIVNVCANHFSHRQSTVCPHRTFLHTFIPPVPQPFMIHPPNYALIFPVPLALSRSPVLSFPIFKDWL